MQLARVFSDYMVLQRSKPVFVWGYSEKKQRIPVKINHKKVCDADIAEGEFSFLIPAQEAAENVLVEIGDIGLEHVDIGEVWIAGGQSNMEFMLQYTEDGEEEIAAAADDHLRTYIVGKYSFAGERKEGYKAWNPWDCWLAYCPEHAAELPAVAVYFAKELRRQGVPVGILSCNWGGTSASAWLDRADLLADKDLKSYVDDFDELVAGLDLEKYYAVKKMIRPMMASRESQKMMGVTLKNTFKPEETERMMAGQKGADTGENLSKLSIAEIMAVGPGDPNEPGALYENMVKEIAGYSLQGVIWYQGETDDKKPQMYAKLFSALIACWRKDWQAKNAVMERLPFLFVQLAPFGVWRESTSESYPVLRSQQELVSKTVPDVYMTCISDIGNVYDIHPKVKKPVGKRLARLAEKYVYQMDILADAPEANGLEKEGDSVRIRFRNGEGLYKKENDFSVYNGFALSEIREDLIPPVLDGIGGLKLYVDKEPVTEAACSVGNGQLRIDSPKLGNAAHVRIEFAQTGFHQVNLYNAADIPVKPFLLDIHYVSEPGQGG